MIEKRLINSLKENSILYKTYIKMMGDASSRVYYRVFLEDNFTSEKTFIAMVLPKNLEVNEKGDTSFIREEPFINMHRYLIKSDLNIPEIYLNDEKNRVVLLEDLGDLTLYKLIIKDSRKNLEGKYKKAIDELIIFQNYTFNNENNDIYAFKRKFDKDILKWELEHFVQWRVNEGRGIKLSEKNMRIVDRYFEDIVKKIIKFPQVIVHRDFQSKNIMVKNNKYYLIDFQDALIGSYVYDLVALLKDSYVELDEEFVVNILKYYINEKKEKSSIEYDFDKLYEDFKLQAVQRKLKDTGRFHFIDIVKNNPSFLQYLPLSKRYVREYLSELYPELNEIFYDALK